MLPNDSRESVVSIEEEGEGGLLHGSSKEFSSGEIDRHAPRPEPAVEVQKQEARKEEVQKEEAQKEEVQKEEVQKEEPRVETKEEIREERREEEIVETKEEAVSQKPESDPMDGGDSSAATNASSGDIQESDVEQKEYVESKDHVPSEELAAPVVTLEATPELTRKEDPVKQEVIEAISENIEEPPQKGDEPQREVPVETHVVTVEESLPEKTADQIRTPEKEETQPSTKTEEVVAPVSVEVSVTLAGTELNKVAEDEEITSRPPPLDDAPIKSAKPRSSFAVTNQVALEAVGLRINTLEAEVAELTKKQAEITYG